MKKIFSRKKKGPDSGGHGSLDQTSVDDASLRSSHSSLNSTTSSTGSNRKPAKLETFDDSKTSRSFQYSYNSNTNSLFSSKHTFSTAPSTHPSSALSYGNAKKQSSCEGTSLLTEDKRSTFTSIGRPLRVLNEEELEEEDVSVLKDLAPPLSRQHYGRRKSNFSDDNNSIATDKTSFTAANSVYGSGSSATNYPTEQELQQLIDFIERQLKALSTTIFNTLIQVSQSVLNLTKASLNISESIRNTLNNVSKQKMLSHLPAYYFNTVSSLGLRKLIKNILYLIDNLLVSEVYDNSKALVLKALHDLLTKIKLLAPSQDQDLRSYISLMSPSLFPIGSTPQEFPNRSQVTKIVDNLVAKSREKLFVDQAGAFIAPVLRGFESEDLAVITFVFGFPELTKEHSDIIKFFSTSSEDMHFLAQKNYIKLASSKTTRAPQIPTTKFKAPFRTLDPSSEYAPISMPLSCNNSLTSSGTLAGYVYPKIPKNCTNSKLLKYADSIFGLTCAHVMLNESTSDGNNGSQYPQVSVPSPVLINLYKKALLNERLKYDATSEEYKAYNQAVAQIDQLYPVSEVVIKNKKLKRNLPADSFGQIVWGERIIKNDRLSDVAIIKINQKSNKKHLNYLGEDLNLNQHDPSLMFSNLHVRKVVSLKNDKSQEPSSLMNLADLEVFKVGSTTNFTKGRLNGLKMIYWSDGSLKTSEFVISSDKKNFASGGDSGSFILTKLSSVNQENVRQTFNNQGIPTMPIGRHVVPSTSRRSILSTFIDNFLPPSSAASTGPENGLGVVGMLHSYDGEFKQFGLFSPIDDILARLEEVTGISWGVVGCDEHTATTSMATTDDDADADDIDEFVNDDHAHSLDSA